MQGESAQYVDPAEIPAAADVARLGQALAAGRRGDLHELMANTAAYSRAAARRAVRPDRRPDRPGRPRHRRGPQGDRGRRAPATPGRPRAASAARPSTPPAPRRATRWPSKIAARIQQARAEQEAGTNPLGLMFPSPRGTWWRSSNFDRRVLAPAYLAAGWRDAAGNGPWTWHSLRHVLCTTALFTWKLDATDVSAMAGHANVRTTLDMYIGTTAGILDRARTATE